jgi:hypothetical protein
VFSTTETRKNSEEILIAEVRMSRLQDCNFRSLMFFSLIIFVVGFFTDAVLGQKLKPEELVTRHLESIGTAEARSSIKSRVIGGMVQATYRSPGTAQFNGQAVMASEGLKSLIGMSFETANQPQENLGYDGENDTVSFARPGRRSNLGDFILTHQDVLKNGLVGGTLSNSWALLYLTEKKPKLGYGGTKKIGGRPMHELKYSPRGGSDLEIRLFLDAETFQHIRTEYTRTISAQLGGNVDASASQRLTRYKMIEDFADFRKEGDLTLPHTYRIGLELDTTGGTFAGTWELTLTQFAFNKEIQAGSFNVTVN